MPTRPSSSTARSVAAALETVLSWARIISVICQPTLYSGCRLVSGSWKITAMSLPRICCSDRVSRPTRFTPSKTALPEICPPGVSPSRLWVSTVFPLPDSPTIPSVRPRSTANETPRTACTTPSAVGKLTRRSVTSSRLIDPSHVVPAAAPDGELRHALRRGEARVLDYAGKLSLFPYSRRNRSRGRPPGIAAGARTARPGMCTHPYPAGPPLTRSPVLEPDVGDVGPADVRLVDDRGRARLLHVRARVHQQLLAEQRDDDGIAHHVVVGLVPQAAGLADARRRLRLLDQAVQLGAAVAAVVGGVQHAVGLEQRGDDRAAVVPEPVGEPPGLPHVPDARLGVGRRVAEVDEEGPARLRLAVQFHPARPQARLERLEDRLVDAVVRVQVRHGQAVLVAGLGQHRLALGRAALVVRGRVQVVVLVTHVARRDGRVEDRGHGRPAENLLHGH